MKNMIKFTVCALAFSAVAALADSDKKGEKVAVAELPAAVTQAVNEKWSDAQITEAKRVTKDDKLCYKVTVVKDGKSKVAMIDSDGKIQKTKDKEKKQD